MVHQTPRKKSKGPWYCYMLQGHGRAGKQYTYVGKTNHMTRRIRQHNGLLKCGGAHRTKKHRPHYPFVIVSGFPSEQAVLQFEWAMKHRRVKAPGGGPRGRIQTLQKLLRTPKWTRKSPFTIKLKLTVHTIYSRQQYLDHLPVNNVIERALVRDMCCVEYIFNMTPRDIISTCTP